MVICCKFKKNFFNLWLYTHLSWFNECVQWADNPRGQNFDVNRNLLSLRSFATSLKKNSVWFYTICFHDFIHVYSPRAGPDNPLGTKFWCQQEPLVTSVICCKFQKISLKSVLYNKCSLAGADSPQGTKFWCQQICLVTSFICCKFKKNIFEVWFYTYFFFMI